MRGFMILIERTPPACNGTVIGLHDRYERPIRIERAHIMSLRLSDTIPSVTLFKYLTDDNLESVESSEKNSIYKYGAAALRFAGYRRRIVMCNGAQRTGRARRART